MNRQPALQLLARARPVLQQRYGVTRLALFGFTARDQVCLDSAVGVLVAFDGVATAARYFGVQFYLEDEPGRSVDPVPDKALRPELRPFVEREVVEVGARPRQTKPRSANRHGAGNVGCEVSTRPRPTAGSTTRAERFAPPSDTAYALWAPCRRVSARRS